MRNVRAVIALLVFGIACDTTHTTPTTPTNPPPRSSLNGRTITIGETVSGELSTHGAVNEFEFKAPISGTFVATVNWMGTDSRIELQVEKKLVASSTARQFEGRFAVVAGEDYDARIADGAPWDYDEFRVTYTLSTTIEPSH